MFALTRVQKPPALFILHKTITAKFAVSTNFQNTLLTFSVIGCIL